MQQDRAPTPNRAAAVNPYLQPVPWAPFLGCRVQAQRRAFPGHFQVSGVCKWWAGSWEAPGALPEGLPPSFLLAPLQTEN